MRNQRANVGRNFKTWRFEITKLHSFQDQAPKINKNRDDEV